MKIRLEDRLAFVSVSLAHGGLRLQLDRVALDTGSAATVFAADEVAKIGLLPSPEDLLYRMVGVGGGEFVFSKRLETLTLGDTEVQGVSIQVGALQYGFPLQGLLGLDLLVRARALIDLGHLEIRTS